MPRPKVDNKRERYNFTADPDLKPRLEAMVKRLANHKVSESRLIEVLCLFALPLFEASERPSSLLDEIPLAPTPEATSK